MAPCRSPRGITCGHSMAHSRHVTSICRMNESKRCLLGTPPYGFSPPPPDKSQELSWARLVSLTSGQKGRHPHSSAPGPPPAGQTAKPNPPTFRSHGARVRSKGRENERGNARVPYTVGLLPPAPPPVPRRSRPRWQHVGLRFPPDAERESHASKPRIGLC